MGKTSEIVLNGVDEKDSNEVLIEKVIDKCFEIENLDEKKLYVSITLTIPEEIRKINKKYRNIDKETDVLSFHIFEKEDIENFRKDNSKSSNGEFIQEVLGDIIISIPRVEKQAEEYGHSFERELSYMLVHGFYHLMGYDHIEEQDKELMREKEEKVLKSLAINR